MQHRHPIVQLAYKSRLSQAVCQLEEAYILLARYRRGLPCCLCTAWFEPAICRGTMLQGDPSSSGYESAGGQGLGRVAEETLASASHMSSADKHAAGRLIHLQSAYAVHDPETGYCQG